MLLHFPCFRLSDVRLYTGASLVMMASQKLGSDKFFSFLQIYTGSCDDERAYSGDLVKYYTHQQNQKQVAYIISLRLKWGSVLYRRYDWLPKENFTCLANIYSINRQRFGDGKATKTCIYKIMNNGFQSWYKNGNLRASSKLTLSKNKSHKSFLFTMLNLHMCVIWTFCFLIITIK